MQLVFWTIGCPVWNLQIQDVPKKIPVYLQQVLSVVDGTYPAAHWQTPFRHKALTSSQAAYRPQATPNSTNNTIQRRRNQHHQLVALNSCLYFTRFATIYITYYLSCNTWLLLFVLVYLTAFASCCSLSCSLSVSFFSLFCFIVYFCEVEY